MGRVQCSSKFRKCPGSRNMHNCTKQSLCNNSQHVHSPIFQVGWRKKHTIDAFIAQWNSYLQAKHLPYYCTIQQHQLVQSCDALATTKTMILYMLASNKYYVGLHRTLRNTVLLSFSSEGMQHLGQLSNYVYPALLCIHVYTHEA